MRTFNYLFPVLISVAVLGLPLTAAADPKDQAAKDLCEPLKAPGVTKGLYGLCVAYNFGGANSDAVLANYNAKATGPNDPPMPGTVPEADPCACWSPALIESVYALEEAGILEHDPDNTFDFGSFLLVTFSGAANMVSLAVDLDNNDCYRYVTTPEGDDDKVEFGVDVEFFGACVDDVAGLLIDFPPAP